MTAEPDEHRHRRTPMRRTRPLLLAVTITFALPIGAAACGKTSVDPQGSPPATGGAPGSTTAPPGVPDAGDPLAGRTFLSTSIVKAGTPTTLVSNTEGPGRIRIEFREGGKVNAHAGCNGIGGDYTIEGTTLKVTEGGMTAMACDPPAAMEQDTWFAGILSGGPTFVVDGDTLTLTAGTTVIELTDREVADPDRALVGPTWTVDTVIQGDTASSSAGSAPTVVFAADGTFRYDDSCGGGKVRWTQDGDRLTFSQPDPDPANQMCSTMTHAEAALRQLIEAGSASIEIEAARLTLMAGEDGIALRAG